MTAKVIINVPIVVDCTITPVSMEDAQKAGINYMDVVQLSNFVMPEQITLGAADIVIVTPAYA